MPSHDIKEVQVGKEHDGADSGVGEDASELSVGDVTETSISNETSPSSVRIRMITQKAASLSQKQNDISMSFASMVTKMAAVIEQQENELYDKIVGDSTISNEGQRKRQEMSEKVISTVSAMTKKQINIGKYFEKLISELEEANRQKDMEQRELKKLLNQMKDKMRKMGLDQQQTQLRRMSQQTTNGHDYVNSVRPRVSGTSSARIPITISSQSPFDNEYSKRRVSSSELPPRSNKQQSQLQQQHHRQQQLHHNSIHDHSLTNDSERTEEFSIREISFSTIVVDIEEYTKNVDELSMGGCDDAVGDNVRILL